MMLEAFHKRRDEVHAALGELCELARGVGAGALAGRVEADVRKKLAEDRFHLVVVGEFNHGKTSFVNALLGAQVLPTGVTPTTAAIHHVVHGDEKRATLVRKGGEEETLPFAELPRFSAEGQQDPDSISYIEVAYPSEFLAERIVLVDTPGVNDLSLTRAEITYDYIPRSDAVLFLLDAGQPVKESERDFLEKQLIKRSRDKIVFVVSKADIWEGDEREEALGYIERSLGELVPSPVVFPISAEKHLEGKADESGMPELLGHMTNFLTEERGSIVLDNALGEGLLAARLIGRGIGARKRAATLSLEQLDKRIRLLEQDLAGQAETSEQRRLMVREEAGSIKAWARRDLDRFVEDTVRQLPNMVEDSSAADIKQHLGAFLEQAFRDWAQKESEEMAQALEKLAERAIALTQEDASEAGKRLSDAMGGDLSPPKIQVDTFAVDVGILAMMGVGVSVLFANLMLGGILLAAGPALAVWHRGRTEREVRKKALELAPVALREAASKVAPKLDELVDDFTAKLDAWITATSEELHREVIEVLRSVRSERAETEVSSDDLRASCEADADKLAAVEKQLNGLKESFGKGAETTDEVVVGLGAEAPPAETPTNGSPTNGAPISAGDPDGGN